MPLSSQFTSPGKKLFSLLLAFSLYTYSFSQTSIFSASSVPAIPAETDGIAIETGVKFRVTQAGFITGIRFYKGALNTGTHIGHLWSSTGTKLAEVTFTGESASGWQQMLFTTPVAVAVNTTYVASYFSSAGYYAYTNPFFTAATVNGPLTALANGTDGGNGVYIYSAASAFPNNTYQTTNYWVDVVYTTSIGPDVIPPTVNITAPVAGNVSGTITVTGNATDNIGVVGVQFKLNGVNLGAEDLTSPYSISWNTGTSPNGNYTLTAVARDAAGNPTTSASVAVTINNDTQAPTVSLTSPAAGNVSGTINVNATAGDNVGVAGIQFLLDGANLGAEDVASPYSLSWNTATIGNGNHTLTARARDAAGNTTTSTAVIVNVNNAPDTQAPAVNITAPTGGVVSGTVTVTANATDSVGVAGVQFLLNGANLGTEDLTSPYSISWSTVTVANGNYTLTARARDAAGNVTTSSPVAVTVSNTTLIAALPMNEGSGTTTADISGNSHPGTLTNAPTWGAGKYGQGLTLNGTNSYVSIADHNDFSLDPTQSYTWSVWIKNTSFKEWSTVWSQTLNNSNFFYFYAHTTTDVDGGPVTNGISVYWWNGNNRLGAHSSNNVLTAGQWSYVAVSYDASQLQNNRFSIYVNGVDVTVRTDVSSSGTLAAINPTNIRIGSNQPFGEYLNGSVDEVRFYKRLLTLADVQADMNTPLSPDATAPVVSITAPAAGNVSGTINVTANATDNVGVVGVQFLLDGANLGTEDIASPYSVSWNTTTASNGNHTLTARARDAAGNITTSTGVIVTVSNDTQAPTVSITAPTTGTVSGAMNVDANASDNVGVVGVQFLLDGINLGSEDITAPYSIPWNTTTVTDGNHTLTAKARDAAGNITTSAGVIVTVSNDAEAPTVSITAPAAGNVSGTINVSANASDNIGVTFVQFLLNGSNLGTADSVAPYSISWNTATVANGNYTLTARARDAAGNTTISAGVIVTVGNDTQAPAVSITAPTADTVAGTINIDAAASDDIAVVGVQFLLDGIALGAEDITAPYSISWNTTTVADSNHTLRARARDAAGNITTSAAVVVTVHNDTQSPTVTITSPPGGNVSGTINVTANASDNVGVTFVQFLLNGSNLGTADSTAPYSISWNTTTVANGNYTLTARARDASGNTTTSPGVVVTVGNDTQVPVVSLTAPTADTVAGTINVDANASDDVGVVGVQFLLDGATLGAEDLTAPYSISWNTTAVSDSSHTLRARARDAAGNITTSAPKVITVRNDIQSPTVTITSPVAGNVSGTINVTANASDNIGVIGVQFLLNGANLGSEDITAPYSVSWNTTIISNGSYTLTAKARDASGNITTSPAVVVTVSNDTQAPTITITAPAAGTVSGTINVTANASDNIGVKGVQFLLDGANLNAEDTTAPYSTSWNTTTIADGNHTLTARARDAAGNTTTSAAVVVNVHNDTQAPAVTIIAPVAGNVSGTISVTATATDNVIVKGVQFLLNGANLNAEDTTSPYTISWNTQTVPNGAYTLTARARDASGNTTTSAGIDVTVSNATSLIAAINMNEGVGTAAADVSGNNHNGSLVSTPAWVAGKYGQAVNFNGSSNYINIPPHADFVLSPTQSYTWSAWIKNTNFAEWGPVWSQTVDANNFFYFYAHTTTDLDGGPVTNGISVYWWNNGGTNKIGAHSSNNVLTAGQWSYVSVVYDATQVQNNRFSIYVNGVDVTVRTDVASTGTIAAINTTNVRIASDQPFDEFLNGAIDELRVYKKALSAAEIVTDMNTPIATGIVPSVTPLNSATNVSLATALTAVFNVDMNASTINASTFELRDANNTLITATIDYNASTRTATLTPGSLLLGSSVYTAKIKGGASGVKDALGNAMTNDYLWSFTTLDPLSLPITEGPGGPILVVSSASNPFSRYAVEILRAEGLNEFTAADIASVTTTMLNNYDVVILGEMTVNSTQVTMFTNWVNAGGTLIAFKPSALLAPLMGLSAAGSTLIDKYLLVNTASGPGIGIVNQTIQFHGTANLYTLNGATSLATLYSTSSSPTTNPAVTTINVGPNGGKAVAFTYDLARSIVLTRQGDTNKAGVETDGQSPVRPDDLFFPSYVDLNKVAIPQADEQQRLLANIIIQSNLNKKPLPRFWYLPNGYKAAVIYALDDHGTSSGTTDIFNKLASNSTVGCSVDNWECLRATSWFYVGIPLTNSQAVNYLNQGFDMGVHVQNGCNNFSSFANLDANYTGQLDDLHSTYPGLPTQIGHRFHCLVWSDWLTQAKVELSHGMRFSLDYYYWPPSWINGRPGLFTGSGMPMRFADLDGTMIDVYQGVSQLVNENGIDYAVDINTLLDNAIGTPGYYGMFGTHDDYRDVTYSNVTIASAKARNVPIISVKQALTWLDGRNNSSFGNMVWNNNKLSFTVTARANANNIRAMLPFNSANGQLDSITRNGSAVSFTTQTIKGIQYAFFAPVTGTSNYVATYSSGGARIAGNPVTDITPLPLTSVATAEATKKINTEDISAASELSVAVMPNPSVEYFNMVIRGGDSSPVTVRISDMFGRLIEMHDKITTSGILRLGQKWTSGTYVAEVVQGDQRKIIKLIKTN